MALKLEMEHPPTEESNQLSGNMSGEIVRDASYFTVCTYIYQVAALAVGMVTRRFLGPEGAGTWSLFMMVLSYSALQHFGIIDGSERQIAYYRGKGRHDYALNIKNNMFGVVGIISIVSALAIIITALVAKSIFADHISWALFHTGLIIPAFMAVNYATVAMRATKRFKLLGGSLVAVAGLNATVGIYLVWRWQLEGMFASFLMINLANLLLWYFLTRHDDSISFKFSLSKSISREVFKVGLPITVLGLIWTLLRTVDSLVVVSSSGTEALEFYALGVTINGFIFQSPNALSIVMFPRFQEKFGQSSDIMELKDYVVKPTTALAFFVLPLLIGSAYFLAPVLIELVLPKFVPGIIPLKILLGGTFWISMVLMPFHLLITINRQVTAIYFGLIGAALSFGGSILAVRLGWGLSGVASMVALSYMIFFLWLFSYVVRSSKWKVKPIKYLAGIILGYFWMVMAALGIDNLITSGANITTQIALAVLKTFLFIILCAPLFVIAERRTSVVSRCRQHFGEIISKARGRHKTDGRKID